MKWRRFALIRAIRIVAVSLFLNEPTMQHLAVTPLIDGDGTLDGPLGLDLTHMRDGLRKVSGLTKMPGRHLFGMETNSIPFGLGLDMDDVQEWVLFDRHANRWAGAHWERGRFEAKANFTTQSFCDACTFFLAEFGRWDNLFELLKKEQGKPAHVYADAIQFDPDAGKITTDIRGAFMAVEKRLRQNRMQGIVSDVGDLVAPGIRLYARQEAYCLECTTNGNQCWFSSIGWALKAFILVVLKRNILPLDRKSVFVE